MTMNTLSAFTLLLMGLFQCLNALAAPTGPEIAQLINNRYQSTASTCAASKPAWQCNGVLVQAKTRTTGQTFWQHDSDATALGAEGFSYLRRDLGIRQLPVHYGVIFSDLFTAVGDGKTLDVLCSYPFTQELNANRSASGCGLPAALQSTLADASSCSAIGVTDSSTWLAHFQQSENQPAAQCSLSAEDARQFDASLKAHEAMGSEWSATVNRLQVANWDSTTPASIPVQALFYDINQTGTLSNAQQDQRDYFKATGDWLPVLRMDLNDSSGKVFGFNLQDQLYVGYQVADHMNQRFANDAPACPDGSAAYNCNGVLFRSNLATTQFHAWDPSPGSIANNGVSFSYARKDVSILSVVFSRPYGFTFRELAAPTIHHPELRCAYPYDAGTSGSPDPCTFLGECVALDIHTVADWKAKYNSNPGRGCAFANTPEQFQLSIDVRHEYPTRTDWNEMMMAAWQGVPATDLPLEALFYLHNSTGLPQAQFIQHDYFTQTERFLPVVRMTLNATDGRVFGYLPEDQLAVGAPGTRSLDCYSSAPEASDPRPDGLCSDDANRGDSRPAATLTVISDSRQNDGSRAQ